MLNNNPKKKAADFATPEKRGGFTLVEVIVALFIIMIGIMSGYTLVNQTLSSSKSISMRLTALYLGKEGIEIARAIRDGNYVKERLSEEDSVNWINGLAPGGFPNSVNCTAASGGCIANYNSDLLLSYEVSQPLKYSPDTGFYSYYAGADTVYRRTIMVDPDGEDTLIVAVNVAWSDRGKPYSLTVREDIYDWAPWRD